VAEIQHIAENASRGPDKKYLLMAQIECPLSGAKRISPE
jgi:hypothetical protein